MKKLIILAALAAICSGCITRWADLTLLSSKNVDVRKAHFVDNKKRITGETLQHVIVCFPVGQLHIKEAVDRAIESAPGAVALSDATVEHGWWYIPYIYGRGWFTVEGNPVFEQEADLNDLPAGIRPARTK